MPYRQAAASCVVHLVHLHHLSSAQTAQCVALRKESGRLWADLVRLHATARDQGVWLAAADLEQATKGGQYTLGSQSVQAMCQKFAANVATTMTIRQEQAQHNVTPLMAYPHHTPTYQTAVWKDQGVVWDNMEHPGQIGLKNGLGRAYLWLDVPQRYVGADARRVELTWRVDHYELCLTLDSGESLPDPLVVEEEVSAGAVAGVDLGEVHIAAVTTTRGNGLVLIGRLLRSYKQRRNKAQSTLQERLVRCTDLHSRRAKRLQRRKAQVSAKLYRQQRNLLHHAARDVVRFCQEDGVQRIAVGDVRDIQTGVSLGKVTNQKISQWPHGQFTRYLKEKAARVGIRVEWIDESRSTKTCSYCGRVRASSPRGRVYTCPGGGKPINPSANHPGVPRHPAHFHRDINGSNNICSRAVNGVYGTVQAVSIKYRRPIVVGPATRATASER